jgi:hypothetical protein
MIPIIVSTSKRDCSTGYTDGWGCYKLPVPAIVGIVLGCVIFLFAIAVVTFLCCKLRRRKQKRRNGQKENNFFYMGSQDPEQIPYNPDAY